MKSLESSSNIMNEFADGLEQLERFERFLVEILRALMS